MNGEHIESIVLTTFREILQKKKLTLESNFFGEGGDSLLALEASFAISSKLGQEVDPLFIFAFPTASGCATAIREGQTAIA